MDRRVMLMMTATTQLKLPAEQTRKQTLWQQRTHGTGSATRRRTMQTSPLSLFSYQLSRFIHTTARSEDNQDLRPS